jgi:hypothetical protein|eukprot:COSAG01_NODE_3384_length_6158_cov_1.609176_5_plen_133_part_00
MCRQVPTQFAQPLLRLIVVRICLFHFLNLIQLDATVLMPATAATASCYDRCLALARFFLLRWRRCCRGTESDDANTPAHRREEALDVFVRAASGGGVPGGSTVSSKASSYSQLCRCFSNCMSMPTSDGTTGT